MDHLDRLQKATEAKEKALDMYEGKIANHTIVAAEMVVYMKLLSQLGLEGPAAVAPSKFEPPPFDDSEDEPIPFVRGG